MHIDLLDPASFDGGHPHAQYAWLREHAPVYRHAEPNGPGFWAVTRHEDVAAIGRDPRTFSSEPTIMIADPLGGGLAAGDHKMMLMMDPPAHTAFRKVISRQFTQGPAAVLRPRIEALSRQIVDEVIERGECDFVADMAGELPSYVIAELMGIPLDDGRELYRLTETLHTAPEALPPAPRCRRRRRCSTTPPACTARSSRIRSRIWRAGSSTPRSTAAAST